MKGGTASWKETRSRTCATSPQSKRTVTARTAGPTLLLEWNVGYIKDHWPGIMRKLKDKAWKHLAHYYELGEKA